MPFRITESPKSIDDINHFLIDNYHTYVTKTSAFKDVDVKYFESIIDETLKNIFVVLIEGKRASILNKFYIDVEKEELDQLLKLLSEKYGVSHIYLNKILTPLKCSDGLNSIKEFEILDNIASLPESFPEFINSLGKTTKKHSKYYLGRMTRDFPSVEYLTYENSDITKDDFDRIIALSKERMAQKSLHYGGSDHDDWLFKNVTADCGFLSCVKIDGQIVAGCIGFILRDHLYLSKIAHDPEYNNYNAGQVGLLKCIEWAITEKGVSQFHFLWGRNVDYKDRFGGKPYPLYNFYIFRKADREYWSTLLRCRIKEKKNSFMDFLRSNKFLLKTYHKLTYRPK